jgi:hypothetical protein
MLDVMLALDGVAKVIKPFETDQSLQSIPLGEGFHESGAMLKHSTDEIICHPDVQNAVRTIGQNIDVSTCHAEILQDVDGRDIGERKRRRPSDGYARP